MNTDMRGPGQTSRGMPVPKELALAAAMGRLEGTIRGHVSVLRGAMVKHPSSDSEVAAMNAAIKWVRKNHSLMDELSRSDALASISYLALFRITDPVEAGLAIRMLYGKDIKGLGNTLGRFVRNMRAGMNKEYLFNPDAMEACKHLGLLCAAMGDTNSIRMAVFWADEALGADEHTPEGRKMAGNLADVPTKAVRMNIAYHEAVQRLRAELGQLRAGNNAGA